MKKIQGNFYKKSFISIDQLAIEDIFQIFSMADFYKDGIEKGSVFSDLVGQIMAALFYEPSSRTFGTFLSAMQKLGGGVIPIHGIKNSSVAKGETLEDTIRTFSCSSDLIVLRHFEKGASKKAEKIATVPVVNAGDGTGEHPTQALLDLYTIYKSLKRTDRLKIAFVGDLKYGRTVHSLFKILSLFSGNEIFFLSPEESPMPKELLVKNGKPKTKSSYVRNLEEVITKIDVLYMTRIQKERMKPEIYEKIKNLFILNGKVAAKMKKEAIILHPLPRVGEIAVEVDKNPRALYLAKQMKNALYVRMALLRLILKK